MTNTTTRRHFVKLVSAGGASLAMTGCEQATDTLAQLLDPQPDGDFRPPGAAEIDEPAHLLDRITWGAAPGEYARVAEMGVEAFVEEQLEPDRIGDRRCDWAVASIESLNEPTAELYEHHPRQLLLDMTRYKLLRAVHSRRQLYEVMVDFWTDHFNIVSEKGHCKWLKAADDRGVIRRHALGSFRELVRASAVSPAMLIYLDGHDNKVEHPGDRPNENYARELLELHTLGVHGGYTQRDVMEVARCLSGWTYQHTPMKLRPAHVEFDPTRHDDGPKEVLGHAIPARGGAEDLERVLDIVCTHEATARYVATRLCRRFVADPAPAAVVTATAEAFLSSGGDIRSTLRAMLATDEFKQSRGTLFKRPLRFVVSALRATGARTNCGPPVIESLHRMGHAPFQYPTPDGYPIESAPWMGTLLWRWNFALDLQAGRLDGSRLDADRLARIGDDEAVAAHLLGRRPTEIELEVLQASAVPVALMLASPAFQRH